MKYYRQYMNSHSSFAIARVSALQFAGGTADLV